MFGGFYNVTSSILTQTRNLDVISNNMANTSTAGYKADQMAVRNFSQHLAYRTDSLEENRHTTIGVTDGKVIGDRNYVDFTQGTLKQTKNPLDFAIEGKGFFEIKTENGMEYTRNGSFSLDNENYLCLQGSGRVQGERGDIKVMDGLILENNLKIVDFNDYENDLVKDAGNTFKARNQGNVVENVPIKRYMIEMANLDPIEQMTKMMAAQRALQSNTQIMKMYDELAAKVVSKISIV